MANFIPLLMFSVVTNAAAQILLKNGMIRFSSFEFSPAGIALAIPQIFLSPFVIVGLGVMFVSMASYLIVLSRVDLSYAFPFLSLAYVLVAIYGRYFFGEDMNFYRISGIAVICFGTFLVSRS